MEVKQSGTFQHGEGGDGDMAPTLSKTLRYLPKGIWLHKKVKTNLLQVALSLLPGACCIRDESTALSGPSSSSPATSHFRET